LVNCKKQEAEAESMKTVYTNGRVYTGELPLKEAFIVEDGEFIFSGSSRDALSVSGASETVDLCGRFVMAGFNDSHMHLVHFGLSLRSAQLASHTGSIEEVISALKAYIAKNNIPKGNWVIGRGWNHDYFRGQKRFPNRYDLDEVTKEHPICISRACGHVCAVNSKALEIIGRIPDSIAGGAADRDENGEPLGIFRENAMGLVFGKIPPPTREEIKDAILAASAVLNSYGITSCQSDDLGSADSPYDVIEAYRELEREGRLTVRVYEQSNLGSLDELKEFIRRGYNTGKGSDLFKIGPLKLFSDGSLGARTAYLSEPYCDDPSTRGILACRKEDMEDIISYANGCGMQVAVHAIGDGAMDVAICAIEKALNEHPRSDHRHGIVHCQITTPRLIEKFRELSLHAYFQSIFLDYDIRIVEDRVGPARAGSAYNFKTLFESGISASNGSDCPVELTDVLAGVQCAVTRQTLAGDTAPYLPAEALSVKEALDSYTVYGAHASFEENFKGRIAPGMTADFVILERDPFCEPPHTLKDIPVLSAYLGGELIFSRG
jgi:predicted amidohydrolase YtcJ